MSTKSQNRCPSSRDKRAGSRLTRPQILRRLICGVLVSSVVLPRLSYADPNVIDIGVEKSQENEQTSAGSTTTTSFSFDTVVNGAFNGSILNAGFTPPGGSLFSLPSQDRITYSTEFDGIASKAALDAAFPSGGNYVYSIQTATGSYNPSVVLTADAYPNVPMIQNSTWVSGALQVAATQDNTLTWNSPGSSGADSVWIGIDGAVSFQPVGMGPTATSYTIAAGALISGVKYDVSLSFFNNNTFSNDNGTALHSDFRQDLSFVIQTTGTTPQLYWTGVPTSTWDNTTTNWSTDPSGNPAVKWTPSAANFTGSGSITVGDDITVAALNFGTGSYTFNVDQSLTIIGSGITNSSATQTFITTSSSSITFTNFATAGTSTTFLNAGNLSFDDSSTAGGAAITNLGATANGGVGGTTSFSYLAGNAIITNQAGTANNAGGGVTNFTNGSSADNATIINGGASVRGAFGGFTSFTGTSTAGLANITNQASTVNVPFNGAPGGTTFFDTSSADGAAIANQGATVSGGQGGQTTFVDGSTAGNATITNDPSVAGATPGTTFFNNSSSAGSATITNLGSGMGGTGGAVYFFGSADGGTARVINTGNGVFDISGLTDGGMKIGSIQGSGTFFLGGNTLTVGGNNLDTNVSGVIADGGGSGWHRWFSGEDGHGRPGASPAPIPTPARQRSAMAHCRLAEWSRAQMWPAPSMPRAPLVLPAAPPSRCMTSRVTHWGITSPPPAAVPR